MENQSIDQTQDTFRTNTQKVFCRFCGKEIDAEVVVCIHCGKQVQELKGPQQPHVVITNTNTSTNVNTNNNVNTTSMTQGLKPKNKWIAFVSCLFLGIWGAHKFYEGKMLLGVVYIFTLGFCGIGVFIDLIVLLFKPNPYF